MKTYQILPYTCLALSLLFLGLYVFFSRPIARATSSGDWNDPNTWEDRRIPRAGDFVIIESGVVVALRSGQVAKCAGVENHGTVECYSSRTINFDRKP